MSRAPHARKEKAVRDFANVAAELAHRWPVRRLRTTAKVLVEQLLDHGGVMTRQDLRDAARVLIGDTGLIDFVLKSIGDCHVDGHVIRRCRNPLTRVLEFSLDDEQQQQSSDTCGSAVVQAQNLVKGKKVLLLHPRRPRTSTRLSRSCSAPIFVSGQMIEDPSGFCSVACEAIKGPFDHDNPSDTGNHPGYSSSDPIIPKLACDLEVAYSRGEEPLPLTSLSPALTDSAAEYLNSSIDLTQSQKVSRAQRRKGTPRRAPFF